MTPRQDSLNSCFSEVTGRGHIDAACFPRQHLNTAGQWCTPVHGCTLASALEQTPAQLPLHGQTVPRLTKALLEANDRIYKLNAPLASPTETPAASEQLCRPAAFMQAGAIEAVSAAQQHCMSHIDVPCSQSAQQPDRDVSDTASETGSSSTPPPRKGRHRTAICRSTYRKAAAGPIQPPPAPAFRRAQVPFPWARTTTSKVVQKLLAMQAPEATPSHEAIPPCKAARLAPRCSPGQKTSCPAALPACPRSELAAELAVPGCPELIANLPDASKAASLPSGVAEWRVQIWPVPANCTYLGALPRGA